VGCNSSTVDNTFTVTKSTATSRGADSEVVQFLIVGFQSARPLDSLSRIPLRDVAAITLRRGSRHAVQSVAGRALELVLPDVRMSSHHARLSPADGVWFAEDLGSKNGTRVNGYLVTRRALADGDLLEVGSTTLVFRELTLAKSASLAKGVHTLELRREPRPLATLSPALEQTFEQLRLMAPGRRSVLITGETGTGKELVARTVHELSGRTGPFVPVNCAAIPPTLVESSFFGVKKGAFSGATEERDGWVRTAHGGTLFLDEVAELSERSQAALLRVLQEGTVVPVGGTRTIEVDVRFLAATHRNLRARVQDGRFREDLYARLAAHHAHLPALRDRPEDLGLLSGCTLHAASDDVSLRREVVRRMYGYRWPRNIRELDNMLASAITLAQGGVIELAHLPNELRVDDAPAARTAPLVDVADPDALRQTLVELYRRYEGNVSAVARALGKARMQIQRWNKRFGIDPGAFRKPE